VASAETALPIVAAVEAPLDPPRARLIARGLDEAHASVSAYCGRGPWWNAGASHMHQAIPNRFLRAPGLLSFLEEHRRLACSS